MIECAMPQDILKYKAKFIGNFSAREVVCMGAGVAVGLTGFFTFLSGIPTTPRVYVTAAIIIPFFLLGFLKPFGQPLEKIAVQMLYDNLLCPPVRKYEIRHPEFEKYLSGSEEDKEDSEISSKKKKKKPESKEKKVAKSKEYKAIL